MQAFCQMFSGTFDALRLFVAIEFRMAIRLATFALRNVALLSRKFQRDKHVGQSINVVNVFVVIFLFYFHTE